MPVFPFDFLLKTLYTLYMIKKYLHPIVAASLSISLLLGCAACKTNTSSGGSLPAKSFNKNSGDFSVSRADAQNFWLRKLEQDKPELHAMTLLAMLLSKDTGKEIFVVAKTNNLNSRVVYLVTPVRGGSESLFSFSFKDNYFSFDHYNLLSKDGPSLADATYELEISRRVQGYYKELGVK